MTVNAAATFAASTTFSNSLIANQGVTITGDSSINGFFSLPDDKQVYMGTDNDFKIGYTNSLDVSFIQSTATQLILQTPSALIADTAAGATGYSFFKGDTTSTIVYHGGDGTARVTTSATGINIGGAIDAVTSITGSGDITIATDKFTLDSSTGDAVFGGNITGGGSVLATTGTDFQLGSTGSAKLGVGRQATTYNLEVEGSIYSTGSTIIAGNGSAGKFILQKGAAAISMNFTNNVGTDEVLIDGSGRFGIGKAPQQLLDVSGNANFDGDITVITTNPTLNTGGKIFARELELTDPSTGATTILNAISGGGGLSRGKVYFLAN